MCWQPAFRAATLVCTARKPLAQRVRRQHGRARAQDIFSLFHLGKDFKFVSKTSIFLIPIVGWSMWLTGAPHLVPLTV